MDFTHRCKKEPVHIRCKRRLIIKAGYHNFTIHKYLLKEKINLAKTKMNPFSDSSPKHSRRQVPYFIVEGIERRPWGKEDLGSSPTHLNLDKSLNLLVL